MSRNQPSANAAQEKNATNICKSIIVVFSFEDIFSVQTKNFVHVLLKIRFFVNTPTWSLPLLGDSVISPFSPFRRRVRIIFNAIVSPISTIVADVGLP